MGEPASTATGAPTRILYIAGLGKCGSTILSMILGQIPGFVALGELRYFWGPGLPEGGTCSCTRPFEECPFWSAVLGSAFPDGRPDSARVHATVRRVLRLRRVPLYLLPGGWPRMRRTLDAYTGHVAAMYGAIAALPGTRVIVDESKMAVYASWLAEIPSLDVFVLHLVRDPRASAFSWSHARRPRASTEPPELRMPVPKTALLWQIANPLVERKFGGRDGRYLRIRYEDFVRAPRATVEAVLTFVGEADLRTPVMPDNQVSIDPVHLMSANNGARSRTGLIDIRADDEWRLSMSRRSKTVATILSLPMLLRYGYRLRS